VLLSLHVNKHELNYYLIGGLSGGSNNTIRHTTHKNTHVTQNETSRPIKTAHEATQTIKDTLHTLIQHTQKIKISL
jgi:hypothetical protein